MTGPTPRARTGRARRLAALTALLLAACAVNPATGERQLALISEEQEVAMGRDAHREITSGGAVLRDPELEGYVADIGQRLAAASERPDLPWTFQVLDEPVVNAFALPGGYIYLTRGILAHFENEAQLAAVLGHEIGHVTARHHVSQASRATLAQLGVGLGAVLAGDAAAPLADLAQTGVQLLLLSYSREAENQSDTLGLRYMAQAGYAPGEMADVLEMLGRVGEAQGGSGLPSWLSTHPEPADRAKRVRDIMEREGLAAGGSVEREAYLARIDGLPYGADPREGYFENGRFLHPRLAFRIDFPEGWQNVNQTQAVVGLAPEGDAALSLGLADAGDAETAARQFAGRGDLRALELTRSRTGAGEGFAVPFEAQAQGTAIRGRGVFVEHGGRVFQLLAYAEASAFEERAGLFRQWTDSFQPIRDPSALRREPLRLELVRLDGATTLRAFHERMPSQVPLGELARLNQVEVDERLEAGRVVKRVVR